MVASLTITGDAISTTTEKPLSTPEFMASTKPAAFESQQKTEGLSTTATDFSSLDVPQTVTSASTGTSNTPPPSSISEATTGRDYDKLSALDLATLSPSGQRMKPAALLLATHGPEWRNAVLRFRAH